MAHHITFEEWSALLADLVAHTPTGLTGEATEQALHLRAQATQGVIEAEICSGKMTPRIQVTSGRAMVGDLDEVQAGVEDYQRLLEGLRLLRLRAQVHLRWPAAIWPAGYCPCDTCGATGKTSHRPCERCNGTGKR